jgi:hypothetical protein
MPDPEWARAGVTAPAHYGGLGDPTRWGAQITQHMPDIDGVVFRGAVLQSGQILSVACQDSYPRAWTLIGMLGAPRAAWLLPDGIALNQFASALYVTMGMGQTQVVHNYNLRAIIDADAPYYWFSDFISPFGSEGLETRAFIMPGAVVGCSINIQIFNSLFTNVATPAFDFFTSLIVTPFDPGVSKR